MIIFKYGVPNDTLREKAYEGLLKCDPIFDQYDVNTVVTSTTDSEHSHKFSAHYRGDAWDLRSKHLKTSERKKEVLYKLKGTLGPDYLVILELEGKPQEHIHLQWRPLYKPVVLIA